MEIRLLHVQEDEAILSKPPQQPLMILRRVNAPEHR
jgi:hypothetical protein